MINKIYFIPLYKKVKEICLSHKLFVIKIALIILIFSFNKQ